jgi:hypothetical protein
VREAVVVGAVLQVFVKMAWYLLPLSPVPAVKLNVGFVAPEIGAKTLEPFGSTYHCTVGVGLPVPAAVNVAV